MNNQKMIVLSLWKWSNFRRSISK